VNAEATLALLGELYQSLSVANARIQQLEAELAEARKTPEK
jgi:hypothetical protein